MLSLVALVVFGGLTEKTEAQESGVRSQLQDSTTQVDSNLQFTQRSAGRIAGSYTDTDSAISFSSRLSSTENRSTVGLQPAVAHVEVNGKSFAWTANPKTNISKFDGPDVTLTEEDARSLDKAATDLWNSLLSKNPNKYELPPEQIWLTVVLSYLAEAPVGHKFDDGIESTEDTYTEGSKTTNKGASIQACREATLESGDFAALASCARKDNDSLRFTCQSRNRNQSHDARD